MIGTNVYIKNNRLSTPNNYKSNNTNTFLYLKYIFQNHTAIQTFTHPNHQCRVKPLIIALSKAHQLGTTVIRHQIGDHAIELPLAVWECIKEVRQCKIMAD